MRPVGKGDPQNAYSSAKTDYIPIGPQGLS